MGGGGRKERCRRETFVGAEAGVERERLPMWSVSGMPSLSACGSVFVDCVGSGRMLALVYAHDLSRPIFFGWFAVAAPFCLFSMHASIHPTRCPFLHALLAHACTSTLFPCTGPFFSLTRPSRHPPSRAHTRTDPRSASLYHPPPPHLHCSPPFRVCARRPRQDGSFKASEYMRVTLSCDHRTVDGAVGAAFLQSLKGYLTNPSSMLL